MFNTLFIHAGQGKTGTSYLQNVLTEKSEELFNTYNILLPGTKNGGKPITSGNGHLLYTLQKPEVEAMLKKNSLLFTREQFYRELAEKPETKQWLYELQKKGIQVKFLFYIRNPFDLAPSAYAQFIQTRWCFKLRGIHKPSV